MGSVRLAANGAWGKPRVLMVQHRGIAGNGPDRFRDAGRRVILQPKDLTSGDVKAPYRRA